jgi:hypothetical protein
MVDQTFQLKASALALVFHFAVFIVLMGLLYQVLLIWLWAICVVIGLAFYFLFFKSKTNVCLQYLAEDEWTLTVPNSHTQRVKISHLIDHQVYVVIYFKHAAAKPLLIWCDQLPKKQWKNLKIMTTLM